MNEKTSSTVLPNDRAMRNASSSDDRPARYGWARAVERFLVLTILAVLVLAGRDSL
ncbi:MAG: hypothetical protein ACOC2N_08180 [Spirochaetota bacterium]